MNTLDIRLLEKNIDDVADYDFLNNKVFGSAYYVYQKGSIVFEKCYGKTGLPGDNEKNNTIYQQYKELADKENNVIFGGRLAEYKYYDMAPIIEQVLNQF